MNNVNVSNIRVIKRSFSFIVGYFAGVVPDFKNVEGGFPSLFSISEERYKWSENYYKIGFKSLSPTLRNEDLYTTDLIGNLTEDNKNKTFFDFGFYEIKKLENNEICNLKDKLLLVNMAKNEDNSYIETVVKVSEVDGLIKFENVTSLEENIEFLSLADFKDIISHAELNMRELVLLIGEKGTSESWLRDQTLRNYE